MRYTFFTGYEIVNTDTYQTLPSGSDDCDGVCKTKDAVRAIYNARIESIQALMPPDMDAEPQTFAQLQAELATRLGGKLDAGGGPTTYYYWVNGRLVCVTTQELVAGSETLPDPDVDSDVGMITARYTVGWTDEH